MKKENKMILNNFIKICESQGIEPIKKLQKLQLDYVATSTIFEDDLFFQMKYDSDAEYVSIVDRVDNFIFLNNGSKIYILDFIKLYEKIDPVVKQVLDNLENNDTKNLTIHSFYNYVETLTNVKIKNKDYIVVGDVNSESIKMVERNKNNKNR